MLDQYEDLATFRRFLEGERATIDDAVHRIKYDAPTRGVWWESVDELREAAERLVKACEDVRS